VPKIHTFNHFLAEKYNGKLLEQRSTFTTHGCYVRVLYEFPLNEIKGAVEKVTFSEVFIESIIVYPGGREIFGKVSKENLDREERELYDLVFATNIRNKVRKIPKGNDVYEVGYYVGDDRREYLHRYTSIDEIEENIKYIPYKHYVKWITFYPCDFSMIYNPNDRKIFGENSCENLSDQEKELVELVKKANSSDVMKYCC
jgi:hypothetical protein